MTRDNWRDAVANIQQTNRPATALQHPLAAIAGIELPQDVPQLVAAARLQRALGADIGSTDEFDIRSGENGNFSSTFSSRLSRKIAKVRQPDQDGRRS